MSGDHIRVKLLEFNMVRPSPLLITCILKPETLITISKDELFKQLEASSSGVYKLYEHICHREDNEFSL